MTNSSLRNLSVQQLRQALAIRERMETLEREFSKLLGTTAAAAPAGTGLRGRRRRVMSAAGRAALRAAARARWARVKASKTTVLPASRRGGGRKAISAAGRARIAAAARARWARIKAAGGRTLGDIGRRRRTLSPAARARIAAATRARWAKLKASKSA
jgi:hypothetical protein